MYFENRQLQRIIKDLKGLMERYAVKPEVVGLCKTEFIIPDNMEGKTVKLKLLFHEAGKPQIVYPEYLAYVNGKIAQGVDENHREILISSNAKAGERYEVEFKPYTAMPEEASNIYPVLYVHDYEIEKLYFNLLVPFETAKNYDKEDPRYYETMGHLVNAVKLLDMRIDHSDEFYVSVRLANKYMEDEFYGKYCNSSGTGPVVHAVGHTHIDVAWLWTLAQTEEKVVNSFSTVLALMDEYPEYIFMSSQPQLYKYFKKNEPELYEKIKQRVKEGRWETEGAMWVEADCNLSSGESLIRQIMFGKRFFKEEFNNDSKLLWLPDVFGYSAALPQILKKCGVDYFITSKISWNEYNKMPYDTFYWKGIDGSEVLTHFITAKEIRHGQVQSSHYTTYNAILCSETIKGTWDRYQQKPINNRVIIPYGYGDGGGGTTREMIENGKRLAYGVPGCPKVEFGNSCSFMDKIKSNLEGKRVPKWVGELYLELHRGTYTSIARNKRYNRKSEIAFQNCEQINAAAAVLLGYSYPQKEINEGWETILLNQFHDIIPGSSIKEVYEDSEAQYDAITESVCKMTDLAVSEIIKNVKSEQDGIVVFNPTGFKAEGIVEIEGCSPMYVSGIPANGYKFISDTGIDYGKTEITFSENSGKLVFDTKYYTLSLDLEDGTIAGLTDKEADREVFTGPANVILAFEDKPYAHDAWDIVAYYEYKMWELNDLQSIEVIENNKARCVIEVKKTFQNSTITQCIVLYNHTKRIDFKTVIDWKEKEILLKTLFPVNVHTEKATYDIQFGNLERSTHRNTSWDFAKFEVCAHKWADVSEGNYGMSILNDCKYGYDVLGSDMRLTLLKSAIHPNPDADKGVHEFTYSIYPHNGDFKTGGTVGEAYLLNNPLTAFKAAANPDGVLSGEFSFVSCDCENVVIETIKKAEDNDDIIIRLYECYNMTLNSACLHFGINVSKAYECDLLENPISEIPVRDNNSIDIKVLPYEIKTIRIK